MRNGRYGSPPRQLWRCYPPNGGQPHSFAGALPRQVLDDGHTCPSCESDLAAHQGPRAPRTWAFPVREAAAALAAVGAGMTYTAASEVARERSGRPLFANGLGAQLVANWVEVLTPVVAARHAETAWPETIVCDKTTFMTTNVRTGQRSQAFAVMAVWGYHEGVRRGRLWALRASHHADEPAWSEVLAQLPGTPRLVVSDLDQALHNAVANRWPLPGAAPRNWSPVPAEPFVKWCEHHLYQLGRQQLRDAGLGRDPDHMRRLSRAFKSPQGWAAFRRGVAAVPAVDAWADGVDRWVRAQASWRGRLPPHHANGAVETALQIVRKFIRARAYSFRNATRTNRLLELARIRINRGGDEVAYAADIREHLTADRPLDKQLTCVDHGTRPRHRNRPPGYQPPPSSLRS